MAQIVLFILFAAFAFALDRYTDLTFGQIGGLFVALLLVVTIVVLINVATVKSPNLKRHRGAPARNNGVFRYRDSMSGKEFELYCQNRFVEYGCDVIQTPSTGDKGADLIVDIDGLRIAVQCKRNKRPVGNRAIQEVFSATALYYADHGAVVSNAGFTPAARDAARAHNISLITHEQISEFVNEIRNQRSLN